MPFDLKSILIAAGYPGMAAAIFAETGLLVGIFLPGDTLLLTAGFLAQRGQLSLWILGPLFCVAAILGDQTGYYIGRELGPRLFRKESGFWFRKQHLERARRFFNRHGGKTVFLARFIGFIRTFAPAVAGAADMHYASFLVYNVAGGCCWVVSLLALGYFLGSKIENLELFIGVLFGGALVLSLIPIGWRWLHKDKKPLSDEHGKRGERTGIRRATDERGSTK